ncbi:MAG: GNAT family N-acetyltransferase [Chitinophagales bacterium]
MGRATERDLPRIAEIFADAFDESVRHVYGYAARPPAIAEMFRVCLAAEPGGFFVAREESGLAVGYCFAPRRVSRLWGVFFSRGFIWRWAAKLVSGQLGVGLAQVRRLLPDKASFLQTALSHRQGGGARILSVGVSSAAQGRGVGTALLKAALGRFDALGEPEVSLEVRPWNEPAVRLYRRHGFVEIGRTRDTQGEWVVMRRKRP